MNKILYNFYYIIKSRFYFLYSRAPSIPTNSTKPKLILYTHDQCSLCEDLVQELEPYKHRFEFRRIDILKKENIRYLQLYRYDIPVLMLNGQFLCMHQLNRELLEKRLKEIEDCQK